MVDHWMEELPEIGVTLRLLALLDEQKEARVQVAISQKRVAEIDDEILAIVKTGWTDEEISEAQKVFEANRRKKWISYQF